MGVPNASHHMAKRFIVINYFNITTLSTVGFGDFAPKSNMERLLIVFSMLFGVSVFSVVMQFLRKLLKDLYKFMNDYEECEQLARFQGTLKAFNKGDKIERSFKENLDSYFI
jgi:hypothetical protein